MFTVNIWQKIRLISDFFFLLYSLDNWIQNNLSSSLITAAPVPAVDHTPFQDLRQYQQIEQIPKSEVDWLTYDSMVQYFAARTALNSFKEGRKLHVANHLRQLGFAKVLAAHLLLDMF